jgi:hypothetical protein
MSEESVRFPVPAPELLPQRFGAVSDCSGAPFDGTAESAPKKGGLMERPSKRLR